MLTLTLALALPLGWRAAQGYEGYVALRVFAFHCATYSVAIFVPLVTVTASWLYRRQAAARSPH